MAEHSSETYPEFSALSRWTSFKASLCQSCVALCCHLPVEASVEDLIRLGLLDEMTPSTPSKKTIRDLQKKGYIKQFRVTNSRFTLAQKPNGSCLFLGPSNRCTVYDKRPEVCRQFPKVGPRPGYCPYRRSTK